MFGRTASNYLLIIVVCLFAFFPAACSDPGEFDETDGGVTDQDAADTSPTPDATDASDTTDAADAADATDAADAGEDTEQDAGPCGQVCSDVTPVCDEASGECVECAQDADCGVELCNTERNECVACLNDSHCGDDAVCDVAAGECEQCVSDDHCTEPGAARCGADNTCQPCTDDSQCAGVSEAGLCAGGTCVECTVDDDTACGATSCDPATNTCTGTEKGSVSTCGRCKADSECPADHRCVEMSFDGTALPDGYCLKLASAGCDQPYSTAITRESISGAAEATYCGLVGSMTTCGAVLDLEQGAQCSTDDDCGIVGENDGRCEQVGTLADRCTYSCSSDSHCLAGFACAGPTGDKYCGGAQ